MAQHSQLTTHNKTPVMRKRILWAVFTLVGVHLAAQQSPHYTQYVMNQYIINPAITGIENYTDIKFSHRHQWMGFEGAPVTSYFTAHKSFGWSNAKSSATSYDVDGGGNSRGKNYWDEYTAADPHHGIGVQIINDRTGPLSNVKASLTYAYHIGLTEKTSISAGFGLGINQLSLDTRKLDYVHTMVDPGVYASGELRRIRPDISAGLYLYSSRLFFGVSAQQIAPQRIEYADSTVKLRSNNVLPHMFMTAGYRILVGDDFNFIPSVMVKYFSATGTQLEVNGKLQYRDLGWIGLSYRSSDALAGMIGFNLSNKVNFGYSYDYTTSILNQFSRGSHEFLLGFVLAKGFDDSCPRNIW
jgi:type IX secretion system PorP/SprF family membrane protein